MKKLLPILLVIVMILSLCACGKKDVSATDPTNISAATGATNATGETKATEGTKATDGTEGTEATTPATKATTPASCSHSWADATCSAAKTCSKCGATEGNALGHNWVDATCKAPKTCSRCNATEGSTADHKYVNDVCSVCNANAPIKDFLGNWWKAYIVRSSEYSEKIPNAGEVLSVYNLKTEIGEEMYAYKDYYSNPSRNEDYYDEISYKGKTYYDYWFSSSMGGFDEIKAEANGNVRVDFMNDDNIVLKRESATKFVVVSSEDPESIPVGTVFEKYN